MNIRHNWTTEEILAVYNTPLMELVYHAATVHRKYHNPSEVQVSSLISVKTGGCTEDCGYCPQAAKYQTDIKVHKLMDVDEVVELATEAKAKGASRACLGAAWRSVRDNQDFDKVLEMVRTITGMNMEVCCTLGMLTEEQAIKLKDAGLFAYNHNLDTSEEKYSEIITTRNYNDRLDTLENIRKAKLVVCSGGIIGMGETVTDRANMLKTLANLPEHPHSTPINALVPVEGTPMENHPKVNIFEMVRMIATTRIVMPGTVIRLSAGRSDMTMEGQALCILAGAGSIFAGDKLLTTPNTRVDQDIEMFHLLGLKTREPFAGQENPVTVSH